MFEPTLILNYNKLVNQQIKQQKISNHKPLSGLEASRLEKTVSPHKIERLDSKTASDILVQDLAAINDFLFYVEAEPFVSPDKANNIKRVAFK